MSLDGTRTNRYGLRLATGGASVTACCGLGGLEQELHLHVFWLLSSAILAVGAVSAVWPTAGAYLLEENECHRAALEGLLPCGENRVDPRGGFRP